MLGDRRGDVIEQAHSGDVARTRQRGAHRHEAIKRAVVIVRRPDLAAGDVGGELNGAVIHVAWRTVTFFQRGGKNERLEAGTGLTPGLGDVVEFVAVEIKPADQRAHRAGAGIQRDQRGLDFGQLHDFPVAFVRGAHAHDGAGADAQVLRRIRFQRRGDKFQPLGGDGKGLAVAEQAQLGGRGGKHNGGEQVILIRPSSQQAGKCFRVVGRAVDVYIAFRAAITVAAVEGQHFLAHGAHGGKLVGAVDGGCNMQAEGVGGVAKLFQSNQACHFCNIIARQVALRRSVRLFAAGVSGLTAHCAHRYRAGFVISGAVDKAFVQHPPQHGQFALARQFRVGNGVVDGRPLRNTGQHGGFGQGEVADGLVEIDLCRRREAVGAVAEEDLVDVDFQNLVFAEVLLDFQRQQRLVELAPEGTLAREEKVARHLHGDGGSALTAPARGDVIDRRAQHAHRVDAAMLVEAGIFGGEDGLFEHIGHLCYIYNRAALLAKFAQQHAIGGVDPHRDARAVVCQASQRRQLRPGVGDCGGNAGSGHHDAGEKKQD